MMDSIQLPQIIQLWCAAIILMAFVIFARVWRVRRDGIRAKVSLPQTTMFFNLILAGQLLIGVIAINIIFYVQREMAGAGL